MNEDEIKTWIKENLELTIEVHKEFFSTARTVHINLGFKEDTYPFSKVYIDLP